MKNFILLLMVSGEAKEKIESIRFKYTGKKIIDALAPHLTLRGRFVLKEGVSEDLLRKSIEEFDISNMQAKADGIDKIGDAIVLNVKKDGILEKHENILKVLKDLTNSIRPERENKSFHPHVTLFRSKEEQAGIKDIPDILSFDRLCLYEIDPSVDKKWVKEVFCRDLA
ncbi:MAG: hypothetical protein NT077_04800 [Candidatus Taylorbacteria bacterium]|nr:hypothetical protein [Candidatus Taylorbacteria bacterium]